MKDRSDDPSHHERTLLPWSYISLPETSQLMNNHNFCTSNTSISLFVDINSMDNMFGIISKFSVLHGIHKSVGNLWPVSNAGTHIAMLRILALTDEKHLIKLNQSTAIWAAGCHELILETQFTYQVSNHIACQVAALLNTSMLIRFTCLAKWSSTIKKSLLNCIYIGS